MTLDVSLRCWCKRAVWPKFAYADGTSVRESDAVLWLKVFCFFFSLCVCVCACKPRPPTYKHPRHLFGITSTCSDSLVSTLWIFDFEGLKWLVWSPRLKKKERKKENPPPKHIQYMFCVCVWVFVRVCVCVFSPACPEFPLILVHLPLPGVNLWGHVWERDGDLKRSIEGYISAILS